MRAMHHSVHGPRKRECMHSAERHETVPEWEGEGGGGEGGWGGGIFTQLHSYLQNVAKHRRHVGEAHF